MISKKLSQQILEGSLTQCKKFLAGSYKDYYITIDYKSSVYIVYINATYENATGKTVFESFLAQHEENMQYLSKTEVKEHVVKLRIVAPKQSKLVPTILNDTIEPVINKLSVCGYKTGCINCGDHSDDIACYQVSGFHHYLCEKCIVELKQESKNNQLKSKETPSKPLHGAIGAILGALVGVAIWVFLYSYNLFAWIAGLAIVFCAYKGYEMLGLRLDKKGFIISTTVIFIMIFFGNHMGWVWKCIDTSKLQSYSLSELLMPKGMWDSPNAKIRYILEMLTGYILTFAIAFQLFKGTYQRSTGSYSIKKMNLS